MRITIRHHTTHRYGATASQAVLALRLTPPSGPGQRVLDWRIEGPGLASGCSYTDAFGNLVHLATAHAGHETLEIVATGVVETVDTGGVAGRTGEAATPEVFLTATAATMPDAAITALAEAARGESRLASLHALMQAVHDAISYRPETTHSRTTAAEALAAGQGVCQDHAHVMLAAARVLGIPARYVTGYLLLEAAGPAAAHHAWIEAEVDGLGWVGFDAANNLCPTERYVRLTTGVDAAGAAPIRGVRRGGSGDRMEVVVEVSAEEA